jgi:hypothetical protein
MAGNAALDGSPGDLAGLPDGVGLEDDAPRKLGEEGRYWVVWLAVFKIMFVVFYALTVTRNVCRNAIPTYFDFGACQCSYTSLSRPALSKTRPTI